MPEWCLPRGIPPATIDSGEGRQEEDGDTSINGSRTLFVTRSGPPSPAGTGHRFGNEAPPVLLLAAAESRDLPPSLAREPPGPIPFSSAIFFEAAASNVAVAGSPQPVTNQRSANAARWACLIRSSDQLRIHRV